MPQSEEPLIPPTAEEASPPDTMAPDPDAPDTVTEAPAAPAGTLPEGWTPVDLATVSPDTLIGADIRTYDEDTVASVEDVLMSAGRQGRERGGALRRLPRLRRDAGAARRRPRSPWSTDADENVIGADEPRRRTS